MHTLLIVHIGHRWPHYIKDCIHQARRINREKDTEIVLIVNGCHYKEVEELQMFYTFQPQYIEELPITQSHQDFMKHIGTVVDLSFRRKYWQYVFERFFILEQYLLLTKKTNVYMIETDNLVYVPLCDVSKTESLFTQNLALPFDSLERGYPSFMFFRNIETVSKLNQYMLVWLQRGLASDMEILGKYRKEFPEEVFSYPVLPSECNNPLKARKSQVGHTATEIEGAFLTDSRFPILFDAIVYGQAIGGIDPCNTGGANTVGYINESALYTIHETKFQWQKQNNNWIPCANSIPIVNLHIHSKALQCFLSDNPTIPDAKYNAKRLEMVLTAEFRE